MKPLSFCTSLVLAFSMIAIHVRADSGDGMCSEVSLAQLALANPNAIPENSCVDTSTSLNSISQCRTNKLAYVNINKAIQHWGISKRGEIVATIAWMLYASDGWKNNYLLGNDKSASASATSAMLNVYNIALYAAEVENAAYSQIIQKMRNGDIAVIQGTDAIISLVLVDEWSFGAGFWYLANIASTYHNQPDRLRDGNQEDFIDYMKNGVRADLSTRYNECVGWWQAANATIMINQTRQIPRKEGLVD